MRQDSLPRRVLARARTLPERHGARALVALALILAVGFALRLDRVLDPIDTNYQGSDAVFYERISQAIYEDGAYGTPQMSSRFDWSPGAPLLYAGVYFVTGGVHPGAARLAVALLGLATIVLAYLLGRRFGGAGAGLLAALAAALYPTFIHNAGRLLSEPLAQVTVPAAVLAFLWALERRTPWAWAAPGLLIGISALTRPEYLIFGGALALLALVKVAWDRGPRPGLAAGTILLIAFALPIAPWSIAVSTKLDRFVPVTTGGGKAIYIGTYLPANGLHLDLKRDLMRRFQGRYPVNATELKAQPMQPLLNRIARQRPELERDAALASLGKENLLHYASTEPLPFAWMVAKKMRHMWQGSSNVMRSTGGTILQTALVALGLLGLALLAWRRRFEALLLAVMLGGITLIGGLLLAGTRRNLALMPLVMALAGTGMTWLAATLRELWSSRPSA